MTRESSPFGSRLDEELTRKRLTQQEFASLLGVSQQTVSKWITGDTAPRLRWVPRCEELLDLYPGTLAALLFAPLREEDGTDTTTQGPSSEAVLQRKLGSLSRAERAKVERFIDEIFHRRA